MAGSYLGHGAKYWADRYFESQSQTRIPDDYSSIEWRDKYLNLEKSCALYQAKIADLRTEVEDLRQKASSKPEPELFEGHTVEYWFNEYLRTDRLLKEKEYDYNQRALEEVGGSITSPVQFKGHTAEEWAGFCESEELKNANLSSQLRSASIHLAACLESTEIGGHDAVYWSGQPDKAERILLKYKKLFFLTSVSACLLFFIGLFMGEGYFVPHFTPSSPFINKIQESAQTAHMDGYSNGFKVGQRVGYKGGYKDGYNEGYNEGYSKEKSFNTSSTDYSANPFISMEDIRKRRELLEKENESSSESDSHWTAEKVRQMLESPPSQK